ncbi:MAG: hypothetical protein LW847_05915 [Burkholderiales bacterium]|jgi:hypothetical protein|nr:hypothetical protein [Burkholderiales bacterium]
MKVQIQPQPACIDPRQALEDDAVLVALGREAFAAALERGRRRQAEFAQQTAQAVRAAMLAGRARRGG